MDLSLGLPGSNSLAAAGWPSRTGKKGGKKGQRASGGNRFAAFTTADEPPAGSGGGGGRGSKARQRKEAEKQRRLEELRRLDPKAAEELERRRAERKKGKSKSKGKGEKGGGRSAAGRGGFPPDVYTPAELAEVEEPTAAWLQKPSSNKRVLATWIIAHASAADKARWEVVGSNHKQKAFKRTKLMELQSMVTEAWANRRDETAKWARRLGQGANEGSDPAGATPTAADAEERRVAAEEERRAAAEEERRVAARAAAGEAAASLQRIAAALAEGSVSKACEAMGAAVEAAQEKRRQEEAQRAAEAARPAEAAAKAALPKSADELPFSHVSGFRIPAALPVSAAKKAGQAGVTTLPECLLRFAAVEHLKVTDGNGYCCDACSYEAVHPAAAPPTSSNGVAPEAQKGAGDAAPVQGADDGAAAGAGGSGDEAAAAADAVEEEGDDEEGATSEAESEPDVRERTLRNATRRLLLLDCPEVLTVHLKRFVPTMRGTFAKNSAHVQFSSKLRLRAVVAQRLPAEGDPEAELLEEEDVRYECVGVVVHHGSSIGGGHYTAFARSVNGWHHISDSASSPAQWSQVKSSQAYMVFYQRVRPAPSEEPAAAAQEPTD